MKSFKTFIAEADRSTEMEQIIIDAMNNDIDPQKYRNYDQEAFDIGNNVREFLLKNKIKGKGQPLGTGSFPVSEQWQEWVGKHITGSTKKSTAKTDLIVGKTRISLKTGSAAQLTSAGKQDAIGTFYAAAEKSNLDISQNMMTRLENKMGEMISDVAPADLRTFRKQKKTQSNASAKEQLEKAESILQELNTKIGNLLNSNAKFQAEYAREAMSGLEKFGRGSEAAATHFLIVDFDGTNAHLKTINDDSYVSNIASRMKLDFSFKTGSVKKKGQKTGEYRYLSVFRLSVNKLLETVEECDGNLLTENQIVDKLKGAWNWIKNLFTRAFEWAKSSLENMLEFLELTPQVNYNTSFSWSP